MGKRRTLSVLLLSIAMNAFSQEAPPPVWWPSQWGPADEAGASNAITPEIVMRAVHLISNGKIYSLGRVYESGMPLFGARTWKLTLPGTPSSIVPLGKNRLVYNEELLTTEIGQVGTQFDALGHIGVALGSDTDLSTMRFYNGITMAQLASQTGLKKLGVENVKPIFARGVLADMVSFKGRPLDKGEEITADDIRGALAKQGTPLPRAGDVLLIHTGWGALWMKDNSRFSSGEPGIGLGAADWLASQRVVCVGADTWGVEVVPNPDASLAFPVHVELIPKHGIFIQENLDLSALARDKVYEFAYIFAPLRMKGATGSPGNPIAVK